MGYSACQAKSLPQLEKMVRAAAKDSVQVIVTHHAAEQMVKRRINRAEVDVVLARGRIHMQPEPSLKHGSLECRFEAYVAGRNLGIVVALCDENPGIVVVTAMLVTK